MARALRRPALGALAWACLAWACAKPGLQPREAPGAERPQPPPAPRPSPTPAPQYPQARPVDEGAGVKVRSARLRHDQRSGLTVFYGGVTVTHDTSTLTARELRSRDQGGSAEAVGGVRLVDSGRSFSVEAGQVRYTNAMRDGLLEGGVRLLSLDPYGRPVTVTGRRGGYSGLSRSAWAEGGVRVWRDGLTLTAQRVEMEGDGARLLLLDGVEAGLGSNRARARQAQLLREGQSLALSGAVRASFVPAELRRAAERPWEGGRVDKEEAP